MPKIGDIEARNAAAGLQCIGRKGWGRWAESRTGADGEINSYADAWMVRVPPFCAKSGKGRSADAVFGCRIYKAVIEDYAAAARVT